jgi:hypothetical protein
MKFLFYFFAHASFHNPVYITLFLQGKIGFLKTFLLGPINCTEGFHWDVSIHAYNVL